MRGRTGPSKPEKSLLLTFYLSAAFLLREEERDAGDVKMCHLMEHRVNNMNLTKYECVTEWKDCECAYLED